MRLQDYSHQVDAWNHQVQFNPLLSITSDEAVGSGHHPFWCPPRCLAYSLVQQIFSSS
jgi:hypothetical protein